MKRIKLLFLFTMIAFFSHAQKNTKPGDTTHHVMITYDFFSTDPLKIMRWTKKGKLDTLDSHDVRKLYYGDKINFRVRVNPFLYDVKVNGNNLFENSPLDTAFVKTFTSFFNTGASSGSTTNKKPSAVQDAEEAQTDTLSASTAPAKKELEQLQKNGPPKGNKALASYKIQVQQKKEKIKQQQQEAEEKYKVLREEFLGHNESINQSFSDYQEEKQTLENVFLFALADYKEYDSIIKTINDYVAYKQSQPSFTIDSLKISTEFVLRYHQQNIAGEKIRTQSVFSQMARLNKDYAISTFEDDSTLYSYYKSLSDSVGKEDIGRFSRTYSSFLENLANRNLFEKSYSPDFATADSFRFQIELHPSNRARDFISLYKLSLRDTAFKPYTLPVKRVLKLNISVGLTFMFGGAVPYTYYYSTPKDQLGDSDLVSIKKGDRKSAVVPRIALLTHLYCTNANWIKPALTFGLSTNPADPAETAYMGGASLIMGNNRRMVFTAGVALANTDVLKSRYKTDDPHIKKYYTGIEEADLIEKKLKFGGFAGISYNF